MRYMGEAAVRNATAEDQVFHETVEDYCRARGWALTALDAPEDRAYVHKRMTEDNQRVTAVVVSDVEAVNGVKFRDRTPADLVETSEFPAILDTRDPRQYWLVGTEVWRAQEPIHDVKEAWLLLRAAVRRRQAERERRLMDARRIVGASEGQNPVRRRAIPNDVKMFVWQRDGGNCVGCGTNQDLEFDHIIPFSMGGSDTARNLQLLCGACNRAKGGRLV